MPNREINPTELVIELVSDHSEDTSPIRYQNDTLFINGKEVDITQFEESEEIPHDWIETLYPDNTLHPTEHNGTLEINNQEIKIHGHIRTNQTSRTERKEPKKYTSPPHKTQKGTRNPIIHDTSDFSTEWLNQLTAHNTEKIKHAQDRLYRHTRDRKHENNTSTVLRNAQTYLEDIIEELFNQHNYLDEQYAKETTIATYKDSLDTTIDNIEHRIKKKQASMTEIKSLKHLKKLQEEIKPFENDPDNQLHIYEAALETKISDNSIIHLYSITQDRNRYDERPTIGEEIDRIENELETGSIRETKYKSAIEKLERALKYHLENGTITERRYNAIIEQVDKNKTLNTRLKNKFYRGITTEEQRTYEKLKLKATCNDLPLPDTKILCKTENAYSLFGTYPNLKNNKGNIIYSTEKTQPNLIGIDLQTSILECLCLEGKNTRENIEQTYLTSTEPYENITNAIESLKKMKLISQNKKEGIIKITPLGKTAYEDVVQRALQDISDHRVIYNTLLNKATELDIIERPPANEPPQQYTNRRITDPNTAYAETKTPTTHSTYTTPDIARSKDISNAVTFLTESPKHKTPLKLY